MQQEDPGKIDELQNSLLVISDGMQSLVYQQMLIILKDSVQVCGVPGDDAKSRKEFCQDLISLNNRINHQLSTLKSYVNQIRKVELENRNFLPTLVGKEGDALRKKYETVVELSVLKRPENLLDTVEYIDFKNQFENFSLNNELMKAMKIRYSPTLVGKLANWFALTLALEQLLEG